MNSSLSNSFRAMALNDTSAKSILASVQSLKIQTRFKSFEDENLGSPTKPKKPITAFFRFANENRPSLSAKYPNLKSYEINLMLGKMWQSLDTADRENFVKGYKTDLINYYSNEYTKYRSLLSDDDKRKIKEMKVEIKTRRILVAQQRKLRKLDKPKKPLSSFFRYFAAQKDRKLNETYKDYVERVTTRWNALSDTEKEKYKTSAEEELKYEKSLLQWEQKMLKLGHADVAHGATKELPIPRNPIASKK